MLGAESRAKAQHVIGFLSTRNNRKTPKAFLKKRKKKGNKKKKTLKMFIR